MSRSQLFVGRLPIDIREREVEQVFDKYGRLLRCDVKYGMFGATGRRGSGRTGMAYAFIDYDDRRDAEDAIKYENGRELRGQSIVVEWARGPAHRSGGGRENYGRPSRQVSAEECYRCRRTGHWARDCPESDRGDRYGYQQRSYRQRSRSRSRSRSRRQRRSITKSRSRSRDRERRRRSPSDYRQKSESMSPGREKRRKNRSMSGSISPAKSMSRSRSKSHDKGSRKDKSKKRSKRHGSSKSGSRRSGTKSRSRSNSAEFSGKQDRSPPRSPEDDYVDKHDTDDRNDRSLSRSPRKSLSRSPIKERYRSDESGRSISRSKSR